MIRGPPRSTRVRSSAASDVYKRQLSLSACYEEYNTANQRHRARDGRQRYVVRLIPSGVNRPDIDDLFRGGVCKTSPRKTEQAQHNQDDPKRLIHERYPYCLLYTSDAADDLTRVDLGGRRI